MIVKTLVVGDFGANCYVVGCQDTKEAAVIDPGGDVNTIWSTVKSLGLTLKYIINTHGHVDHIAGNSELKKLSDADIIIHELDADMLTNPASNLSMLTPVSVGSVKADQTVTEGDVISVGSLELKVLHTPGHTPGGMSLVSEDKVFTGDTLFAGSVGRTDFPGGSFADLISSIKEKILTMDEDTEVMPGHGPASTVAKEKTNPFVGG